MSPRSPAPPPRTRPRCGVCCAPSPRSALCTRRKIAATRLLRSARLCELTNPARCGPWRVSFWATKWRVRAGHCRIPSAPATSVSATLSARISPVIWRRIPNLFNAAMLSGTQGVNAEIGAHYPFGNFGWIVDVGGGIGTLLLPILDRHPEMRGTIFELPHVAAQARERIAAAGLAARCDAVEGDALITIPAGADAYLIKFVLHNRTDDEAEAILHNCHHAMPAHAKLLIIERLLPERIDPNDALARENLLADINRMVTGGGRERTEAEYRALLARAGLRLTHIIRTPGPSVIIEAEPG